MSEHIQSLTVGSKEYQYLDLKSLDTNNLDQIPFSHKILLENALRHSLEDETREKDVDSIPVSYTHLTLPTICSV